MNPVWGSTTDHMLRCGGCHTVSLRREDHCSAEDDPDGTPNPIVSYFPAPVPRIQPDWIVHLPTETAGLMEEIYGARSKPAVRLIAMGVRAVIDSVLNAEIGDSGSFEQKLEALITKGLISTNQRELLSAVIDAGSAAGHRGFAPNVALIDAMIDVIENLLHHHYVIAPMVRQQKLSIPPRPPRTARRSRLLPPSQGQLVPPPLGKPK